MTPTEPAEVIEAHRLWMAGEGGSRADLSASTVRRAIDERRIPAMRLTVGGSIRIPADATPPVD